ncbi:MAG TPA: NYN domain-containing protein [Dehalococcoidales bacterium]|nr:NYN domain-containing protein [Dehalococcoidales bacterium]
MEERVMIFIDGSNLYHSLKNYFKRTDLDIGKFCRKILQKRQLIRIYYYNAKVGQKQEPELYKQQQAFFDGVNSIPYTELRLGRLVYTNQWPTVPPYEKGTDVQLATDMITHSYKGNYDVGILIAGDNDFAGAVQAVKDNGKHVEVALFGKQGTSQQLRNVADRIIAINARLLKDCWK